MKRGSLLPLLFTIVGLCLIAVGLTVWLYLDKRVTPPTEPGTDTIDLNTEYFEDNERKSEVAERVVRSDGIVALSIQRFRIGMKRLPWSLDELLSPPSLLATGERWGGPYINNPDILVDPWDEPFQYVSPGSHNDLSYDLWSKGGDGLSGTADDIGNW